MTNDLCHEHSGCATDIKNLKSSDSKQWGEIATMRAKIDGIMTRLNVILGSLIVGVILILINVLAKIV